MNDYAIVSLSDLKYNPILLECLSRLSLSYNVSVVSYSNNIGYIEFDDFPLILCCYFDYLYFGEFYIRDDFLFQIKLVSTIPIYFSNASLFICNDIDNYLMSDRFNPTLFTYKF